MGKISNVIYTDVDPRDYDTQESSEFYWYQNMMGLDNKIDEEYLNYESKQLRTRNRLIRDIIKNENPYYRPNMSNVIFGSSSVRKKVIIVAEV